MAYTLPTAQGLRSRSIEVDPICRRCGKDVETLEHALRDCSWARFLWEVSPLCLTHFDGDELWDIPSWFEKIQRIPQKEHHSTFANIAWVIWFARNMLTFQEREFSHVDCLLMAQRATCTKRVCESPSRSPPTKRECTRRDQVKVWSDVAVELNVGLGFGVIMKDGEGKFLGCRHGFRYGMFTEVEAEAVGVMEAFNFYREKGVSDAIVEMDCLPLLETGET
ncbi:uncharacterized protein LOC130990568 [Salvia miltiorrhiza]|uniref:uncharacterized protein LOC130990568 n=1 Tax=Salvia miltiorrhiza TaxID=226208 RepID=UPI0025AC026D|nr:uncharacterized protein LOC130990568 [Salvia miltiorrhiza]